LFTKDWYDYGGIEVKILSSEVRLVQGNRERARRRLNENGIDLPFPTQQILFPDQTEETDGDRTRQRAGRPTSKGEAPQPRKIAMATEQVVKVLRQNNGWRHA